MNKRLYRGLVSLIILSLLISACGLVEKQVKISIVYGSEKKEWLEPLVQAYNQGKHKTEGGATIIVEATPMGSIEAVDGIMAGHIQPTVWSPASDLYLPVANAEWRKSHSTDLVEGTPSNLVLSPVVIAMWQPMAEALGWPSKPLGWADIAQLATSDQGWEAYGYPEWGGFKFGHTHPNYSNSGLSAVIAQAYAAAEKPRGLEMADLQQDKVKELLSEVQSSIIHYGTSTGFFAERMFERGPSYLSAAVLYENLIVNQENKRLSGASSQLPVVAIYPKEGTFWANHPYAVLSAPWVTEEQKAAAGDFQAFLLDRPQQTKAIELGFRPSDPAIPLTPPLDTLHGVDINQPQTVLAVPGAEVVVGVQALWRQTKKPVDLVLVMDISGSMKGDKISTARQSVLQFINLLDDRDRLQVVIFNNKTTSLTDLSPLGEKRADLQRRVSGIIESGGTSLYDATIESYQGLLANGDPKHIRAVVVLSDGADTESSRTLPDLMAELAANSDEGGNAIKLFTIAFGGNAKEDVLKQIAEATGGQMYVGDPSNIAKIYAEIATFF